MGRYEGKPLNVLWDDDGRHMQLNAPFAFVDGTEERWDVPNGTRIDGASIPRMLWSITGSPYDGKYRDASVVHDFYCSVRARPCEATHLMFHEAMLVSGVSPRKAAIMYAAVRYAGPRWSEMDIYNANLATGGRYGGGMADFGAPDDGGGYGGDHGGGYSGGDYGGGGVGGYRPMSDFPDIDASHEIYADQPQFGPATAPAEVSKNEFSALAKEILAGPLDPHSIAARLEGLDTGRTVDLPSGVYKFDANPEAFDAGPPQ